MERGAWIWRGEKRPLRAVPARIVEDDDIKEVAIEGGALKGRKAASREARARVARITAEYGGQGSGVLEDMGVLDRVQLVGEGEAKNRDEEWEME